MIVNYLYACQHEVHSTKLSTTGKDAGKPSLVQIRIRQVGNVKQVLNLDYNGTASSLKMYNQYCKCGNSKYEDPKGLTALTCYM